MDSIKQLQNYDTIIDKEELFGIIEGDKKYEKL